MRSRRQGSSAATALLALGGLALLAGGCQPAMTGSARSTPPVAGEERPDPQRPGTGGPVYLSDADTALPAAQRRLRAIQPLLHAAAEGRRELPYAAVAARNRVREEDLRLWYDLYDNLGRTGLITPAIPSVPDMAAQMAGTWQIAARRIHGRDVPVNTEIHTRVVSVTGNTATLEMLILEEGILESWVHAGHGGGNDRPFVLGAFFEVRLTTSRNERLVHMDMRGEVWGENYPGLEQPTPVRVVQNLIRLGETYTATRAGDVMAPTEETARVVGRDAWNYVSGVDGIALSYGSFDFDAYDTHRKVSERPLVEQPREFWQAARRGGRPAALRPQRLHGGPQPPRRPVQ
jgi:hypothetical protein